GVEIGAEHRLAVQLRRQPVGESLGRADDQDLVVLADPELAHQWRARVAGLRHPPRRIVQPRVSQSKLKPPGRPLRSAINPASVEIAISDGVLEPILSPIGRCTLATSSGATPSSASAWMCGGS